MLSKDPLLIVRDLLVNNWDKSNTVIDEDPSFHTGWYDYGGTDPQVTITNSDETVMDAGFTGQSAGTGGGGVAQYRTGFCLVNCWAGTYEDMEGKGSNSSDISPKDASYDMSKEVHRIMQANGSGTTDSNGNQQFHSLAASDVRRVVEDEVDPAVFRYEVTVNYTYLHTAE